MIENHSIFIYLVFYLQKDEFNIYNIVFLIS